MAETPLHFQSIACLARRLRSGELSPVALAEHFLERARALDPALNAFHLLCPERALAAARAAEAALAGGIDLGPLHGIPYAAKDLFDVAGLPTHAGSTLLGDAPAAADSAPVAALARAGMVLLGKTNTVEFAYGGVGINHHTGTPRNPWAAEPHVPGGSSSGSGVAVAAGLAPMALGSDTGGSVRIPAALCGVVGLKTTVGRISRAGVFPLSWSLDSVGPLARTVEDAALAFQALQGADPRDPPTLGPGPADALATLDAGVRGLRLAFAETVFWDEVAPEVAAAVRECGRVFADLGARVESIPFPEAAEAQALNRQGLVIAAEAYAVHRERLADRFDRFDPIVGYRIRKGAEIAAADYIRSVRTWEALRVRAAATLAEVDALLVPATMRPAVPLAAADADKDAYAAVNLAYLRNTAIGNILNLCGLALPCGFTAGGLPIGLMLYARPFAEPLLLRIGRAYEQATAWHRRHPPLAEPQPDAASPASP